MRASCLVVAAGLAISCSTFGTAETPAPDAGPAVPDASDTRRFCEKKNAESPAPAYCRDFDDGENILFGWTETTIEKEGGSVTLDTSSSSSVPGSFRARLEPGAPKCSYARTVKTVTAPPSHARVSFDVRIGGENTVATDGASFMTIGVGPCVIIMSATPTAGFFHEQSVAAGDIYHPINRFPLEKQWTHVDVDIDRSTLAVELRIDGVRAFDTAQTLHPTCKGDSSFQLLPGLFCETNGNAPREVRLDNLLVTASP